MGIKDVIQLSEFPEAGPNHWFSLIRRNTQCNMYLQKLDYNLTDALEEAGSKP